jgi:hypothetical protein
MMKKEISPRCAVSWSGILKEKPQAKSVHAICGNVSKSSVRRPKVSIVQIAGQAKVKLTRPNPHEKRRAFLVEAPACAKTVDE